MEQGQQNGSAATIVPSEDIGPRGLWWSAAAAAVLAWVVLLPEPNTWMVEYYRNRSLEGEAVRAEMRGPDIESEAAIAPGILDRDTFSLRLRSCLRLPAAGRYQFRLVADNGARLYVKDELVVDAWSDRRAVVGKTIDLTRGNYPITVEYFDSNGPAKLRVEMAQSGVYTFRDLRGRTERPGSEGICEGT